MKNMRYLICALMGTVLICGCATYQDVSPAEKLPLGLWTWSVESFENNLPIVIESVDGEWSATVQSDSALTTFEQGVVTVIRTEGQKFIGKVSADRASINGHWYQSSSTLGYQDMITPTTITAVKDGRWTANITVQSRPYNVFLDVFKGEEAQTFAVIRNPERNEIQGARRFRVESVDEKHWVLVAGRGDNQIRRLLTRVNDNELRLEHVRFDTALSLRPATADDTIDYYARNTANEASHYTPPVKLNDGWAVTTPEAAGFDRDALDALVADLASSDPRSRRPRMIHSLVVAHKGRLVFEEYFHGYNRETAHDVRSLGKVFASTMIGAFQQQGVSIDEEVRPILGVYERAGERVDDQRKTDINLGDLMTFTSGLDCNGNADSAGSEDRMWEQKQEENYWLYTARLRVLHKPGQRYAYCSGSINLVGSSLRIAGGAPIIDSFDRLIAKPLQFGPYHWVTTPNGASYLGGGMYMRPRDILKIGATYVAGGVWNGEQVFDKHWIEKSTMPKIEISPKTTGMSPDEFGNNYFGGSQAYVWRVDTITVGEKTYDSYEATGNGGQILVIVPALDLAAVFTGGNYGMGGIWGRWRNQIIGGHIIPAMKSLR